MRRPGLLRACLKAVLERNYEPCRCNDRACRRGNRRCSGHRDRPGVSLCAIGVRSRGAAYRLRGYGGGTRPFRKGRVQVRAGSAEDCGGGARKTWRKQRRHFRSAGAHVARYGLLRSRCRTHPQGSDERRLRCACGAESLPAVARSRGERIPSRARQRHARSAGTGSYGICAGAKSFPQSTPSRSW